MSIQLKNLKKGEKVDIVVRRHWIAFVLIATYFFFGIIVSFSILIPFGFSAFSFLLLSVFWMYFSMFLYISWLNYELDLFIFTNNRVVCVEQVSFLNRAIGETTLDKVQEVSIETKGIFANLLDYGTMRIMTAGSSPSFDMTFAPKPMERARYINNLVDRYRDNLYGGSDKNASTEGVTAKIDGVLKAGV